MRLEDYFLDPKTDNCSNLLEQIKILIDTIKPLNDVRLARVPGLLEKYERYLEKKEIPETEQKPKKVMEDLAEYFRGAVRWHHPWTMINITPPPMIPSIAASTVAMLFNPNLAIDVSCGGLAVTELEVIKYMSDLVGWDWRKSMGVFTFGGKGTNLYAVKIALQKYCPDFMNNGIHGKIAIASNTQGHPCHIEICDWLGLGKNNCFRLPVDSSGVLDLGMAEKILSKFLISGGKLPCIIVNGSTTLNYTVDPILKVVEMRDRLVKNFNLDYIPHIHVDSVIGWVWLFFKNYDFQRNPLKIKEIALKKIEDQCKAVSEIKYADSFGVDFHKTGFAPYISSIFIARKKEWLDNLGNSKQPNISELEFGNFAPFTYTLESSRAVNGAISALAIMKCLGYQGFQKLISNLVTSAEIARQDIDEIPGFRAVNQESRGFATLFIVFPQGINLDYKQIIERDDMMTVKTAEYIYKFYLFILEKQVTEGSPVALDYVSGYETTKSGIKFGVMKMYLVSPYCDENSMRKLFKILKEMKKDFDLIVENYVPKVCPFRPKPLVLR